jgi:hypothetical protein
MTTLQKAKLAGFAFIVMVMFGAAVNTNTSVGHPQPTPAQAESEDRAYEQAQWEKKNCSVFDTFLLCRDPDTKRVSARDATQAQVQAQLEAQAKAQGRTVADILQERARARR